MPTVKTKDGVEIFYKDWGTGQPIVFSHGWPLSADDWDAQLLFFLNKGYRVVAHDRRGHGRSTHLKKNWRGNHGMKSWIRPIWRNVCSIKINPASQFQNAKGDS